MSELYSIRESLQGRLQTFIRDGGIQSIFVEDLIRDLVVLLSSYREEDVPMFPAVYVGERKEDFAAVFTTGKPITIGGVSQTSDVASLVLKDCAPLAKEEWAIFVYSNDGGDVNYGVFRSARHSLSTGADETIPDLGRQVKLILLKNCGHQAVELHNTSNHKLTAVFNIAVNTSLRVQPHVSAFVTALTETLSDSFEIQAYMKRLLIKLLQHCHGTLLAVVPVFSEVPQESVTSGIQPNPYIDFAALHAEALRKLDASSLADLRSAEVLLEGMLNSDGIVVFACDGSVRAYRSFVRPNNDEAPLLPVEGGARRRAYELMKLRMPLHYKAVLYRSQDGDTKCEVTQ